MVALFQHGTNREVEPHLHIHALIMNICSREDGSYGTIVNDKLFTHKKLLGAIFRAELAMLLEREMGFVIERDKEDFFRIANVPESLCSEFSKPRKRIESVMAERGLVGGKAAEMVNLQTRRSKEDVPAARTLYTKWGKICDEHGFTQEDSLNCLGWRSIDPEKQWQEAVTEALQRLTYFDNHFTRDQLTCQLVICTQGRGLSVSTLYEKVSQIVSDGFDYPPSHGPPAQGQFLIDPINDCDLISLGEKNGQRLYTAQKTLETDLNILYQATLLDEKLGVLMDTQAIEKASEAYKQECDKLGYSHSQEKLSVIDEILSSDSRLRLINGKSGTAKTSTVRAIVSGWKSQNYKVVGAAPTGSAAEILKNETGIKAATIHRLLGIFPGQTKNDDWDKRHRRNTRAYCDPERMWNEPLDANTVVVVDEASMISSLLMHQLQERVVETGATLLILGDDRQKQSVERSGVFKSLLKRFEHSELNEIVRQKEAWAREMVEYASNQEAGKALKSLAEQEAIWVGKDRAATVEALVEQWERGHFDYGHRQIVIANRNAEVDAINRKCQFIRQKPIEHPERPTVKIYDEDRGYYGNKEQVWVGDQVVITKNRCVYSATDRTHVFNGTVGTVTDIRPDGLVQISLAEKDIQINPESFRHLRLAYAVSSYRAQGNTFDSVLALLEEHTSDMTDFYVQVSRFRESVKVFVDEPTLGGKLASIEESALAKRLENYEPEELAIERYLAMVLPLLLAQKQKEQEPEKPSKLEEKLAEAKRPKDPVDAAIEDAERNILLHKVIINATDEVEKTSACIELHALLLEANDRSELQNSIEIATFNVKQATEELHELSEHFEDDTNEVSTLDSQSFQDEVQRELTEIEDDVEGFIELQEGSVDQLELEDVFRTHEMWDRKHERKRQEADELGQLEYTLKELKEMKGYVVIRDGFKIGGQGLPYYEDPHPELIPSELAIPRPIPEDCEFWVASVPGEKGVFERQLRKKLPTYWQTLLALFAFVWNAMVSTARSIAYALDDTLIEKAFRPACRLFWCVAFLPGILWDRFSTAEEAKNKPVRIAIWIEQTRDKTVLERVGGVLTKLFVKHPYRQYWDAYYQPPYEKAFRFFWYVVGQACRALPATIRAAINVVGFLGKTALAAPMFAYQWLLKKPTAAAWISVTFLGNVVILIACGAIAGIGFLHRLVRSISKAAAL